MADNVHSFSADATPRSVASLRDAAAQAAANAGIAEPVVSQVRLAVSEAASNAVLHAFSSDGHGEVHLDVAIDGDELIVTVRDDGLGFRPRPDSPGAGLGLVIVARIASAVDISTPSDGGTEVRMRFPAGAGAETA